MHGSAEVQLILLSQQRLHVHSLDFLTRSMTSTTCTHTAVHVLAPPQAYPMHLTEQIILRRLHPYWHKARLETSYSKLVFGCAHKKAICCCQLGSIGSRVML